MTEAAIFQAVCGAGLAEVPGAGDGRVRDPLVDVVYPGIREMLAVECNFKLMPITEAEARAQDLGELKCPTELTIAPQQGVREACDSEAEFNEGRQTRRCPALPAQLADRGDRARCGIRNRGTVTLKFAEFKVQMSAQGPRLVLVYGRATIKLQVHRIQIDVLPITRTDAQRVGLHTRCECRKKKGAECR
jgi:hypothetical protein